MIDLNKLKAMAEAASPGPWKVGGSNGRMIYDAQGYLCGDSDLLANAEFKAAANPAAILELIAMASAAAPQVVADERAAFDAAYRKRYAIPPEIEVAFPDSGLAFTWFKEGAHAARAAAPVQAQEPIVQKVCPFCGSIDGTHDNAYPHPRAPVQPVAVPDGKPFAYFVQPSGFGPFIECHPHQVGSFPAYRAAPAAQGDAEKLLATLIANVDTTGGWYIYFKDQPSFPREGWEEAFDIDKWLASASIAIAAKAAS